MNVSNSVTPVYIFLPCADFSQYARLPSGETPGPHTANGTGAAWCVLSGTGVAWSGSTMMRRSGIPALNLENFAHDVFVEFLDRLDLLLERTFVRGLVGRLNMDKHEIFVRKRVPCRGNLARIIGAEVAGGARNEANVEAGKDADAAHQVHGRHHRAGDREPLFDGRQHYRFPLAPEPDVGGRVFPIRLAALIDRTRSKHRPRIFHEAANYILPCAGGKVSRILLTGNIVRRGAVEAFPPGNPR